MTSAQTLSGTIAGSVLHDAVVPQQHTGRPQGLKHQGQAAKVGGVAPIR